MVYANKKRNNLRHSFKLQTVIDDCQTGIMVKTHSPMLAKVEMVSYGSNQLRKKLNFIPDLNLSKNRLLDPVIRGHDYKQRHETRENMQANKAFDPTKLRGKARRESVKLAEEYEF